MNRSCFATFLCLIIPLICGAFIFAYNVFQMRPPGRVWHIDDDIPDDIHNDLNNYMNNVRSIGVGMEAFDKTKYNLKNYLKRKKGKLNKIIALKNRKGTLHVYSSKITVLKKQCVPFKTMVANTKICVHNKKTDGYISGRIRDTGSWEPHLLSDMATVLYENPNMHLIDIGCNVGTYTMYAALIGRKVLGIDPIRSNVFLLHSSLVYARLRKNVTLLLNAVSDLAEPVKVNINNANLGGSSISRIVEETNNEDVIVEAILLNDLTEVVDFKKVIVKMDIEGHEVNAFRRSDKFFEHFDVRYIMMEWMLNRNNLNGQEIIDILSRRGYLPFGGLSMLESRLDVNNYSKWPDNIVWAKLKDTIKHKPIR